MQLGSGDVEARACPGRGNGVFARVPLPAGWMLVDHPVCVVGEGGVRRLPGLYDVDELMEEVTTDPLERGYSRLTSGAFRMSHVPRHLEWQETSEDELPRWATRARLTASAYNLLAAQLQSQVARDESGSGLVLLPQIRLANHACDANTEIGYAPDVRATDCACDVGSFVLRAVRDIAPGEEVSFSYIGAHTLMAPEERDERRALLERRWGFGCECVRCTAQD